jgi:transketolase
MRDAFVRALSELAEQDERILLVNGDLGFGVLTDFIERFPSQYVNAGIAEQNMTAIACGSALTGARAFTYSIGNFPTLRCLEQLRNDFFYHNADVTVVAVGGGFS